MNANRCLLMMAAALGLTACSPVRGKDYFPEPKVGARHQYVIEYRGLLGESEKAGAIVSVDSEESINGHRYYKVITAFSGMPGVSQQIQYSRYSSQGVYTIDEDSKGKGEYLDTPLPVGIGSKWTSKSPTLTTNYEATGIESVLLPEHTYKDCLKVAFTQMKGGQTSGTGIEFLADDIGMVKMEMNTGFMGGSITFTLQEERKR